MRSLSSLLTVSTFFTAVAMLACGDGANADSDESMVTSDGGNDAKRDADAATDAGAKGAIQLVVTVDWEGRDLLDENLRAMEGLHAKFPDVKVTQFLNAAYYLKPGAKSSEVSALIKRGLGPGDEKGLHIHGWKRLFEGAGVTFRSTPTFWGEGGLSNDCNFDCGHEVPISAYTTDELQKVVRFSVDTLSKNGFGRAESFRCGGWVARENVREAVAREGIKYEHSAVPSKFLKGEIGTLDLYDWVDEIWKGTSELSQPFAIKIPAVPTQLSLTEIPDNGALADYMLASEMIDVFEANKAEYLKDPSKNVVLSIGFHQETAGRYISRIEDALDEIFAIAKRENIPIVSVTSPTVGVRL